MSEDVKNLDNAEDISEQASEEVLNDEEQVIEEASEEVQAAVDMLKSARKEDAQKLFAKMTKIDEVDEDNDAEVAEFDKAMKGSLPKKKNELKAKAKVEAVDFDEDLDTIISEEATLSDGFRDKASTIFEAVLTSKLAEEVERLEAEYAQNLEEEVSDIDAQLVEKVDSYLNYVVENWMKERRSC